MQAGLSSEPKVPVCIRADYTIFLEHAFSRTWIHCDVRRWSASVRKAMLADFDALLTLHGGPIYALNDPPGCAKHQKFMVLMGLSWCQTFKESGVTHHVFVRYSNG